jgi:hypothetical protein
VQRISLSIAFTGAVTMALFLLVVIVALLIWIGVKLKPAGPTGWEYLIVNVTGDIEEMTKSLNDRGICESLNERELVMIWSPPREDEELASVLREAAALSKSEAAESKAALEEVGLKPYPRQIYAIFKKRISIGHSAR